MGDALILAVTGGRDTRPTDAELDALWRACMRQKVRVVRFGDCPTGVDAVVQAACEGMGPGLRPGQRRWAWEQWQADRDMLDGDASAGVFCSSATTSVGCVEALVAWPGDRDTFNCVSEARRRGIRVVSIIELL